MVLWRRRGAEGRRRAARAERACRCRRLGTFFRFRGLNLSYAYYFCWAVTGTTIQTALLQIHYCLDINFGSRFGVFCCMYKEEWKRSVIVFIVF